MNCKKGDLAIVRTTHPLRRLHGALLTCKEFKGELFGEVDVWEMEFAGGAQRDDEGDLCKGGYIQDRYLKPIHRPAPDAQDEMLHPLPAPSEPIPA